MVPVPSLDALAFAARLTQRRIVTTLDALQGQLFYSSYRGNTSGIARIDEYTVVAVDDVRSRVLAIDEDCLLVGDSVSQYSSSLPTSDRLQIGGADFRYPSAESLVYLAAPIAKRGEAVQHSEVTIMYLREAYVHAKQRAGAVAARDGSSTLSRDTA